VKRSDASEGYSAPDAALLALGQDLREAGYDFSTVTPLTQARINRRPGNERAKDYAGVFGWSRPFAEDLLPPSLLARMEAAGVLAVCKDGWRSTVRLSTLGQQLFFHSAYPTISPDSVFFGPDTVRFASAIQAHLRVRWTPVMRAVDIGCGAGPGGLLIAGAAPDAHVLMLDINAAALRFSRINAALNRTPNVEVRRSDILKDTSGTFDLIVSNPPYLLDPGGRAYRHGGGHLGEGLSVAILEAAVASLSPGGTLLLYTGSAIVDGVDGFRTAAEQRLAGTTHHWSYFEMDPDVFGEELEAGIYAEADRIAAVVLTVTRED
jgi:methylase of polypeptide subunit release factors